MNIINPKRNHLFVYLQRFTFIYVITYALTLNMSPWGYVIEKFLIRPLTISIGKLFNISFDTFSGGSGDTTYDYFKFALILFISFLIFLGVSYKYKSEKSDRLITWTFTILRYFLIIYLLLYGFAKIFPIQFGNGLHAYTLDKTYGQSSPMNLLWTFMGYSRPYTFFTGLSEVLAALFLLFKRTTLLGGIISFGIMINVFLLNLCYDVPVKLFSGHLLMFSSLIILFYFKSLCNFFFLNKGSKMARVPGFDFSKNGKETILIFKKIFLVIIILLIIASIFGLGKLIVKPHTIKSNLEGIHKIISFQKNGESFNNYDAFNWNKIIIHEDDGWMIELNNGTRKFEEITIDTIKKNIRDTSSCSLDYTINKDSIMFSGAWHDADIKIQTIRTDINDLLLNNRKFNWINETPFIQ